MKYRLPTLAAAIMTVIMIASVTHAQDSLLLEVIVEDITALPGEQGVEIPIYMKNHTDSIAGFNLWLMLDRPDIMEFQMTFDTSGTLISGWEFVAVNSLGGTGHDINIVALANMIPPPQTPGIGYPQYGQIPLLKIYADVYDIADTITNRTAVLDVITEFLDHFSFSDQDGNTIGLAYDSVLDTNWYICTEWLYPDSICLNWQQVPGPPADSIEITWIKVPYLDTTRVLVTDGSLTVPNLICGDIDGSGAIPDVGDLMYLVQYLFGGGPPPPVPDMADVDGSGGIDVADVTYLVSYLFQSGPAPDCIPDSAGVIIADHQIILDFDSIPTAWIEQVKSQYRIFYMHTSHGSQIVSGMSILRDSSNLYDYNNGPGTLYLEEYIDDLGHNGDTSWVPITRQRLDQPSNDINLVIWSWCGGVSDNTEAGINTYLDAVHGLQQDYPDVTFIYMTGHLDGTGPTGNLYVRNNQIRAYCTANDKTLFDFADIESYDPDGTWYPNAGDACEWCSTWCTSHSCPTCICAHSHCFNCYLKGKAFWWLLSRAAGWEGN